MNKLEIIDANRYAWIYDGDHEALFLEGLDDPVSGPCTLKEARSYICEMSGGDIRQERQLQPKDLAEVA